MSQVSSSNSSASHRITPNELNDWSVLLANIPMDPVERQIYVEHMNAMKEFHNQKVVDPKSVPAGRASIDQDFSTSDEGSQNEEERVYDKEEERLKQRDQAKLEYYEEEEFQARQFRKHKDWQARKAMALENLELPIDLATDRMDLLVYGTPIQFINRVPDPDIPEIDLTSVLAVYITPECIARNQLTIDNDSPLSLSLDINPMVRNVFEIICDETDNMKGFPVTYKSMVYIKMHYAEQNRDFFLTVDVSSPYTVGKMYMQDCIDDLCQFQLLSVNSNSNKSQDLIEIHMPVLIRHVKTGFYIMSKANLTVMDICGEERFAIGSDEIEGDNLLWKMIHSYDDDLDFTFESFIRNRWWLPNEPIPERGSNSREDDLSKPSTSRENIGHKRAHHSQKQNHPLQQQWLEVYPGLYKSSGYPGSAREHLQNPEELFTCIKKKPVPKPEPQPNVINCPVSLENIESTPQRDIDIAAKMLTSSSAKSESSKSDPGKVDLGNRLENNNTEIEIRSNKFAKESFSWPKAPEVAAQTLKEVFADSDKIINALKKLNPSTCRIPDRIDKKLSELFVRPRISRITSLTSEGGEKEKLEARLTRLKISEENIPTKLSKDHVDQDRDKKPDNPDLAKPDVSPLNANQTTPNKKRKNTENLPELYEFWSTLPEDNSQLIYDQGDSDAETVVLHDQNDVEEELEDGLITAASPRFEEGQGDICSLLENSDNNNKN